MTALGERRRLHDDGAMTNTNMLPTTSGVTTPMASTVTFTPNMPDGSFDETTLRSGNRFIFHHLDDDAPTVHTIMGFRDGQEMVTMTPSPDGLTSSVCVWEMMTDNVYIFMDWHDIVYLLESAEA